MPRSSGRRSLVRAIGHRNLAVSCTAARAFAIAGLTVGGGELRRPFPPACCRAITERVPARGAELRMPRTPSCPWRVPGRKLRLSVAPPGLGRGHLPAPRPWTHCAIAPDRRQPPARASRAPALSRWKVEIPAPARPRVYATFSPRWLGAALAPVDPGRRRPKGPGSTSPCSASRAPRPEFRSLTSSSPTRRHGAWLFDAPPRFRRLRRPSTSGCATPTLGAVLMRHVTQGRLRFKANPTSIPLRPPCSCIHLTATGAARLIERVAAAAWSTPGGARTNLDSSANA